MDYFLYGAVIVMVIIAGSLVVRRATEPPRLAVPGLRVDEVPSDSLPITFSSLLPPAEILDGIDDALNLPDIPSQGGVLGVHLVERRSNALLIGVGDHGVTRFQVGISVEPKDAGTVGACVILGRTNPRPFPESALLRELRGRIEDALIGMDDKVVIVPLTILLADDDQSEETER